MGASVGEGQGTHLAIDNSHLVLGSGKPGPIAEAMELSDHGMAIDSAALDPKYQPDGESHSMLRKQAPGVAEKGRSTAVVQSEAEAGSEMAGAAVGGKRPVVTAWRRAGRKATSSSAMLMTMLHG